MILIDYNAVAIGNLVVQRLDVEENLLRHMILNSIRMYRQKFQNEYGEIVIVADGQANWRRDVFPQYKYKRRKSRDESKIDWNEAFRIINMVRDEIRDHFPYKVMHEPNCEADDVIARLALETQEFGKHEPIMIISADKDFIQLHKHGNVKQYSPITRKMVSHEDPVLYLREHIFRGDAGDGVPNVLSSDDTFIDEDKKQTPLSKKKIQTWLDDYDNLENVMPSQAYRNYQRNKKVIDLEEIPEEVKTKILDKYNSLKPTPNMKALNYLIVNRMNNLVESVGDFHRK